MHVFRIQQEVADICILHKAIVNSLVGEVLARPPFIKVKTKFHFTNIEQKYLGKFWICSACYIMIEYIEKAYDEVENNWPPTHARIFYETQAITLLCKIK